MKYIERVGWRCVVMALSLACGAQELPNAPAPVGAVAFGDVIDSHDALVPGATVKLFEAGHEETAKSVVSDNAGHWEIRGLTPGVWSLVVSAPELTTFREPKLVLKAGERHEVQGIVLAIASTASEITVTMTTEQVAEQEVHDQEKQRTLAIFPNFNTSYVWNAAPMTAKQKFKLSLRSTLDPVSFATAAAISGYQYNRNKYPEYGTGFSGYAQYYGAAWGTVFIGHTIGYAILPALLRQDPRYFYMGEGGTARQRAIHAVSASVLTRGDSGHTQFNYSRILGNFAAGYISKSYHPGTDKGIGLAVDNMLIGIAGEAGVNLVREFVLMRISSGTPKYGKGKPKGEATNGVHP